jgi:hypothetical protein
MKTPHQDETGQHYRLLEQGEGNEFQFCFILALPTIEKEAR